MSPAEISLIASAEKDPEAEDVPYISSKKIRRLLFSILELRLLVPTIILHY
jgi:hypothetical protein